MKAALILVLALFVAAEAMIPQKRCKTIDDCEGEQCCVHTEALFLKGICSSPTKEGELCNPDPTDKTKDGNFRFACPCVEGLSCQEREETWGTTKYKIHACHK